MHSDWMKKEYKVPTGSWERLNEKLQGQQSLDQLEDKIWKNLVLSVIFVFLGFQSFRMMDSSEVIPDAVDVRVQGHIAKEKKVKSSRVRYFVAQKAGTD